jgi:hypothetical protein
MGSSRTRKRHETCPKMHGLPLLRDIRETPAAPAGNRCLIPKVERAPIATKELV